MTNVEKIEEILKTLKDKEFNIYFFTIDTKGNPTAGVANVYEHVKMLGELGYNAHILHDKEDYTSVESWLGEEYSSLSHKITKDMVVHPSDIIVVPEVYSNVMEQLSKYPCKKMVFAQSHSYIFELLGIGKTWNYDLGFNDVLTTNDAMSEYIKTHFPNINTHVIHPSIPEYFTPSELPKKPVVGIMTRDQKDVLNIVKSFYLQFPMYKWVTFKDLRGLPRTTFAEEVKQNCVSVWVDSISSFGTFPIESMKCETPVIGTIPDLIPEWMVKHGKGTEGSTLRDNGIWTDNVLNVPGLIAEYLRLWLEDSIPENILTEMKELDSSYTPTQQKKQIKDVFSKIVKGRIEDFKEALESEKTKLQENEQ
jgi:hypothetical protein